MPPPRPGVAPMPLGWGAPSVGVPPVPTDPVSVPLGGEAGSEPWSGAGLLFGAGSGLGSGAGGGFAAGAATVIVPALTASVNFRVSAASNETVYVPAGSFVVKLCPTPRFQSSPPSPVIL